MTFVVTKFEEVENNLVWEWWGGWAALPRAWVCVTSTWDHDDVLLLGASASEIL